jgi:C1A family cysteine protease
VSPLPSHLADHFPFVFALGVHRSMTRHPIVHTGVVTMPKRGDALLGGHAVLAVGYRHATRQFIFRNSWGPAWGDRGYGYLPYEFVAASALTWDFWTMRRVT